MTPKEIKTIAQAMLDKKALRVVSLNLKKTGSAIADHFIICDAPSTTQVRAIADNVEEQMIIKHKIKAIRTQGQENGFWVIIDYGDAVVHVFQSEQRDFYRLEDLWADAKRTEYSEEKEDGKQEK